MVPKAWRAGCLALVLAAGSFGYGAPEASAQLSPNLDLKDNDKKDTKAWPHVFPLWGQRVVSKGYGLPLPIGVSLQYYFVTQPIGIDNLSLSANDNPLQPVDFVKFKDADSTVHTASLRVDLWLFPFLNVYGILVGGFPNTTVEVEEPIELVSSVDQKTFGGGFGAVGAFGIGKYWLTADTNFVWSDAELVENSIFTWVFGVRLGRTFHFNNGMSLALWGGAMLQSFNADTVGSIKLSDAVGKEPGEVLDRLEESVDAMPPGPGKIAAQKLLDELREREPGETVINYKIDKSPRFPWNMVLGVQWGIDNHWFLRAEGGLIGRWSGLFSVNYRFGLGG